MATQRLFGSYDVKDNPEIITSGQDWTAEPVKTHQIGLTVASHEFVSKAFSDVVASSTLNTLTLTVHTLQIGDIISFTSGPLAGLQIKAKSVVVLVSTLVNNLPSLPNPGDTVDILRYTFPLVDANGHIVVATVLGNDTNYGVVGPNTLRTAAQIGNATGAAAFGAGTTSAQVLRVVLPTDQTAIPASQSGTWNINNISGTISLPTGAATSANQSTEITALGTINTTLGSPFQTGGSIGNTTFAVTQSTSPWVISGTVTANLGTIDGVSTAANQTTEIASLASIDGKIVHVDTGAVIVSSGSITETNSAAILADTADIETSVASLDSKTVHVDTGAVVISSSALPAGAATSALQTTGNASVFSIDGKLGSLGQKNMAGSAPVVIASDQTALTTVIASSASSAITSVASSASNVTLLSLNTGRKAAYFYNDSTTILYLKFGTTATTSSYTVQLIGGAFYEMPLPVYTGEIDGIWSSANGNVRITELS